MSRPTTATLHRECALRRARPVPTGLSRPTAEGAFRPPVDAGENSPGWRRCRPPDQADAVGVIRCTSAVASRTSVVAGAGAR